MLSDHVVEYRMEEEWRLVTNAVKAHSPLQAVIRAAHAEGLFRARPVADPYVPHSYFRVPTWGPPVPEDAPG